MPSGSLRRFSRARGQPGKLRGLASEANAAISSKTGKQTPMTENVVIEILGGIQTDIAGIQTDITGLKTDMAELRRQGNIHARALDILSQDTRMIRAAVNDIARVDVTAGEVEVMHDDINRLRTEVTELTVRV